MALKISELICILLSALVMGVYWGPWVALSRSMSTFEPEVFLTIVKRMSANLEPVMTVLTPLSLISAIPVFVLTYHAYPATFYFTLSGCAFFIIALLTTVIIEVPIVKQIVTWSVSTLPPNWQKLRNRWVVFHIIRVAGGMVGLALLVIGSLLIS